MKYYCIGIKGSGMSALANLLHDLGNEVFGYDDVKDFKYTEHGLKDRNIKIYYDNSHDIDEDTIVTYSKAFKEDHPEIVRVHELGLEVMEYNEVMGEITKMFKTISVCGTHGKTTTTTMISKIIDEVYGCNYFIGDGTGNIKKGNEYFAIESDEFNRHFLKYSPKISIITNIELEHTECYKDIEDIISTFESFANNNTSDLVIACGDNENIRKIDFNKDVIFYGFNEDNDVVIKNLELTSDGSSFDLYKDNEFIYRFNIPLYGKHMVLNSAASIILGMHIGIDVEKIESVLHGFQNAKRRFAITEVKDTIIIDDYAHHPTEIGVTIEGIRQKYPEKKLAVVFKPNTYSRTKDFYENFAKCLNKADKCYLTEIDCNREKQSEYPGVSSKLIFDLLDNGEMISDDTIDKLLEFKNEVIAFMSCASIEHMKEKLIDLLNE